MKRHSHVVLLSIFIAGFSINAAAQQMEIDFNDPEGLLGIPGVCSRTNSLCSGAPVEFANFYREKGMVFTDGVNPPDPALGPFRYGHYHLSYADPLVFLLADLNTGRIEPFKLFFSPLPVLLPLTHPENEKRVLRPHLPGAVVQMIYDPNNDGVPHPFNLISLEIYKGKINVGTKSPTTGISVYNNLTAPNKYKLLGANNLLRATLELPVQFGVEGEFTVDKIIFEPASFGARSSAGSLPVTLATHTAEAVATPSPPSEIVNDAPASLLLELVDLATPVLDFLHIQKADVEISGPPHDEFHVNGIMHLVSASNGIDVSGEPVIVTFGAFRQMIPAGQFSCNDEDDKRKCHFEGTIGGITSMDISSTATTKDRKAHFLITALDVNLSEVDLRKPVAFALQIKDDLGVTHIFPDKLAKGDNDADDRESSIP